jgi:hypothetical protein
MRSIPFISLFFLLLPYTIFSQSGKVIAKFCPLGLADEVSFPTIQGGLEIGLTKRIAWYNELNIEIHIMKILILQLLNLPDIN